MNDKSPLVSVVVITYNRPELPRKALESVAGQTLRDFEVIVVNDAGPDVSQIVDGFKASGTFRYLAHEQNKGPSAARNTGIRAATGKYIAYLDDDDIYLPEHLEALTGFLGENENVKAAYSDAIWVKQRTEGGGLVTVSEDVWSIGFDADRLLVENFILTPNMVHERACTEKTGLFDEGLWYGEDWEMWIRMSLHCAIGHVGQVTTRCRIVLDGASLSSEKRIGMADQMEVVHRRYEEHTADKPSVRKQQRNVVKLMREQYSNPGSTQHDSLLKRVLLKTIGFKGVDALYRLKVKLMR